MFLLSVNNNDLGTANYCFLQARRSRWARVVTSVKRQVGIAIAVRLVMFGVHTEHRQVTNTLNGFIYRLSQEECEILRESVPYVKLYRYNPKHLYPKLNGYRDNRQRKVWTSCISAFYTPTALSLATPSSSRMIACRAYVGWFYGAQAPPNAIR